MNANTVQEPSNRRKKRRNKNIYQQRGNQKPYWLETHIWHAKRAHIKKLWSYCIPMNPSNKGDRALYKANQYLCTIIDKSYYSCVQIDINISNDINTTAKIYLAKYLNKYFIDHSSINPMNDSILKKLLHKIYINGNKEGTIYIKDKETNELIGPITFFWHQQHESNTTKASIWFWLHPSIYNIFCNKLDYILKDEEDIFKITRLNRQLNRFRLNGARCQSVLSTVLRTNINDNNVEANKVWNQLHSIRTSASLPSNVILSLNVYNQNI